LRVKTEENSTDSIPNISIKKNKIILYAWYKKGYKKAIFTIYYINNYLYGIYTIKSTTAQTESQLSENQLKVYPNPVGNVANLRYQLNEGSEVKVYLYNAMGQMVRDYSRGYENAGSYAVGLDTEGLGSGVYHLKVLIGDGVFNRVLVKG